MAEESSEVMTDGQYDAVIKSVLTIMSRNATLDGAKMDIANLFIDEKNREYFFAQNDKNKSQSQFKENK
jgi:hypothetical protein